LSVHPDRERVVVVTFLITTYSAFRLELLRVSVPGEL
jgi:hypothetical protein